LWKLWLDLLGVTLNGYIPDSREFNECFNGKRVKLQINNDYAASDDLIKEEFTHQ